MIYRSSKDDENVRNVFLENFRLRHVDGAERLPYEGERQVVRVRLRRRLCNNKDRQYYVRFFIYEIKSVRNIWKTTGNRMRFVTR